MKFHLPIKLRMAVLAAMVLTCGIAEAATLPDTESMVAPGVILTETQTITALPDAWVNVDFTGAYSMPVVKDGVDTTLTVQDVGTQTQPQRVGSPLYVREGNVVIDDSYILHHSGYYTGASNAAINANAHPAQAMINVAGNKANLTLNNTTYADTNADSYLAVGGPDGEGTLTLNNSHIRVISATIGYNRDTTWAGTYIVNSTYATTEGGGRYSNGVYTTVDGRPFGAAVVNINQGSVLELGTTAWLAQAVVNVNGGEMNVGSDNTSNDMVLGRKNGCETELNITNGGSLNVNSLASVKTGDYTTGVETKSVKVTVSGTGSALHAGKSLMLGYNANQDVAGQTTLTVSDGGVVSAGSVTIGRDTEQDLSNQTLVTVQGAGSTITTGQFNLVEGASLTLDAASVLQADTMTVSGGAGINLINADNSTPAAITVGSSLSFGESSVFQISLADGYSAESLRVAIAGLDGGEVRGSWLNMNAASLKLNSALWNASGFAIDIVDNVAYATATLTSAKVDDKVVVENKDVILDSEGALGDSPISTSGQTSLSTAEGVTAILPGTIENTGNLTISGSYDGTKIEAVTVAATRVSVEGREGNNGFHRDGGSALVVVDNKGNATLTVADGTTVTGPAGELKLYASGLAAGELDYSNYYIAEAGYAASMSDIQQMRPAGETTPLTITMNAGELIADADAQNIQSTGGTISTVGDVTIGGGDGKISGSTELRVEQGGVTTLAGENDYTGATIISGANSTLKVEDDKALGQSKVLLQDEAALDLNHQAVGNDIAVTGCELHNASEYTGNLDVSGNLTICGSDATVNRLSLTGAGYIESAPSENNTITVNELHAGGPAHVIDADLVVNPDGRVVLNNGSKLDVARSLTLGPGTTIVLHGGEYAKNDVLISAGSATIAEEGRVTLDHGFGIYSVEGSNIILARFFDRRYAELHTLGNWGIVTASRAFVNTVRGQRTNTGCIADGRGTTWAAMLGGYYGLDGSHVNLLGAVIGADMKVGRKSSVGMAMGYIRSDIRPGHMPHYNANGFNIAAYGEHGLWSLSHSSSLSMDWVAAYSHTDSGVHSVNWYQDSVQLNTRLNWNKTVTDRLCMSVFGGLEYFAGNSDTAGGVKTGSIQNLRGEIGMGARYVAWGAPAVLDDKGGTISPACEKLVLHGELRYMNDMVRSNPVIEMDGLRGSASNPGRQGMGVEAGATYRLGGHWSASVNYGFNTMSGTREHRVNLGASCSF